MAETHSHGHSHGADSSERALTLALALTGAFLLVELIGGVITQSLALISDAAHMFTDTAALAIALVAIRIGRKAADDKRTFGYHRFEILAAAFNAMLLFGVAVYIIFEAYLRLTAPAAIESTGMLVIAVVGMLVNLLSMKILTGGKDASLNVKGAYLEVWADMVGSIGVIVGAVVIRFTGWAWVDSLVAVLIGLWVVPRTWTLLKSSVNVLLEGVPEGLDLSKVRRALLAVPGVTSLHDLHAWSLTSGKVSLTVHVVVASGFDVQGKVLPELRERITHDFGISHTTIQCEDAPCAQADEADHFAVPDEQHRH
ncbi:CDF family zinc transporter CzcD [soil metagenome]